MTRCRFIKNYGAHFEGDYAYRAKTPHDFEIPAIPRQKDIVDGIGRVGAKDTPATLDQVIRVGPYFSQRQTFL